MSVKRIPERWDATAAYNVGDIVQYNGIRFENIVAVMANSGGNSIPVENTSWEFDGVLRILDYYSLQYAILEELNTDNEIVINSIPLYIQDVERKLGKLLRSPAKKINRRFTIRDGRDNETLFDIPTDLLDVVHLRADSDNPGYNLDARGSVAIQRTDRTSFESLRQLYTENGYFLDNILEFDYPVYVLSEDTFQITPRLSENVTHVEMTYYQDEPELGSTVERVNEDFEPVNSAGQTLAQWVAAGNDPLNFMVEMITLTTNIWTETAPFVLKEGALVLAYKYLNDPKYAEAQAAFDAILEATNLEFRKADSSGAHASVMGSAYAIE